MILAFGRWTKVQCENGISVRAFRVFAGEKIAF